METQTITREVSLYNNAIGTFGNGAQILERHQLISSKANLAISNLLNEIQANGGIITPDLDKKCNDVIALCNTRKKEMEESRKVITQLFDEIKKLFINEESKLDPKKSDGLINIQQFRNDYAMQLAKIAEEKRKEAERQAKKEIELANIKAVVQLQITNFFSQQKEDRLKKIRTLYSSLHLGNYNIITKEVKVIDSSYMYDDHMGFIPAINLGYVSQEEFERILKLEKINLFNEFSVKFTDAIEEAKNKCLDLIPGRIKELEEIAKADAESAEKMRIEAEERQKRAEADERLRLEAETKAAAEKIEADKSATEMDSLFNQTVNAQVEIEQPEARAGYEIQILNRAGWMQIFQLWFQKDGHNGTDDAMERKTLGSMKKFCEKHAQKTGEKIESKFLKYNEVFTAVNRKN